MTEMITRVLSKERLDWCSLVTVGGEQTEWLCHFWRLAEIASSGPRDTSTMELLCVYAQIFKIWLKLGPRSRDKHT